MCAAAADGFDAGAATDETAAAGDPEGVGFLRWIVRGHFRRRSSACCWGAHVFSSASVAKVASPEDASISFAAARVGRKLVLCEEKHHPARKDIARAVRLVLK